MPHFRTLGVYGAAGVGKTSIVRALAGSGFDPNYVHTTTVNEHNLELVGADWSTIRVLDFPGGSDAVNLAAFPDVCLLVYAVNSRSSFDEVRTISKQLTQASPTNKVEMVFFGNKADLEHERQVTTAGGGDLAKSYGCGFAEGSSREGEVVKRTLEASIQDLFLGAEDFELAAEEDGSDLAASVTYRKSGMTEAEFIESCMEAVRTNPKLVAFSLKGKDATQKAEFYTSTRTRKLGGSKLYTLRKNRG